MCLMLQPFKNKVFRRLTAVMLYLSLYGLNGCSSVYSVLSAEQKRDVYERVSEDVKSHIERAEFLQRTGYLHNALEEYEQARFYGDLALVGPETIELVKTRIKHESHIAYQQGMQALQQKKYAAALQAFSRVMRTDPDYPDAEKYYWRMLNKPENTIRIGELENQLRELLNSSEKDTGAEQQISDLTAEILSYQYDNSLAYEQHMDKYNTYAEQRREGMELVRRGYHEILSGNFMQAEQLFRQARAMKATEHEGVRGLKRLQKRKDAIYLTNLASNSLERGDMAEAEQRAMKAVDADREYTPATVLLKSIVRQRLDSESGIKVAEASKMLDEGKYLDAMKIAEDVLRKEPNHPQATDIYEQARKNLQGSVDDYIELGSLLFNQTRYDEAEVYFEAVLAVDPDNHISRNYLKRIELRRRTLEIFK